MFNLIILYLFTYYIYIFKFDNYIYIFLKHFYILGLSKRRRSGNDRFQYTIDDITEPYFISTPEERKVKNLNVCLSFCSERSRQPLVEEYTLTPP